MNYTNLTWEELLNKTKNWFDLPRVVTEAFRKLLTRVEALEDASIESVTGGFVDNTDPLNPVIVDAPSDGTQYARQDGAWEAVSGGSAGKQLKALIGTTSSGGNITVYTPLVNSIGLITPVWSRLNVGIYSVTFANTTSVFTGTFFATVGGNTSSIDSRIITTRKIGNTFYIDCKNISGGVPADLLPNDKYSLFFESLSN